MRAQGVQRLSYAFGNYADLLQHAVEFRSRYTESLRDFIQGETIRPQADDIQIHGILFPQTAEHSFQIDRIYHQLGCRIRSSLFKSILQQGIQADHPAFTVRSALAVRAAVAVILFRKGSYS